ncbi:hypothetical protein [Streptomyces sp. NPDC054958]
MGASCPGCGAGITAVDYHQAVPVLVSELEGITAALVRWDPLDGATLYPLMTAAEQWPDLWFEPWEPAAPAG